MEVVHETWCQQAVQLVSMFVKDMDAVATLLIQLAASRSQAQSQKIRRRRKKRKRSLQSLQRGLTNYQARWKLRRQRRMQADPGLLRRRKKTIDAIAQRSPNVSSCSSIDAVALDL